MASKKKARRPTAAARAKLVSELRTYITAAVNNTRRIATTKKEARELEKLAEHLRAMSEHADPETGTAWSVFASMADGEAKRLEARSLELQGMLETIDRMAGVTADQIVGTGQRKRKPRK
jgi:hypothetical protein